jgi:hypothetical protein
LSGQRTHAEVGKAELVTDGLDLREVAAGFGASLVQVSRRRAGSSSSAGGLEARPRPSGPPIAITLGPVSLSSSMVVQP